MSLAPVELHRPLAVNQVVGGTAVLREVVASPAECAALAARFAIPAVTALACRFRVAPAAGGVLVAEGELTARITRECVVSLELFEVPVEERFRVRFVPRAVIEADAEAPLDPESDDEIPYAGAVVDLGEAAAEQLALALDPYPRMPGADLPPLDDDPPDDKLPAGDPPHADARAADGPSRPANPFAALARRLPRQ